MRVYREDRCILCKKLQSHDIHRGVDRGPTFWEKLLHLAWPRWIHQPKSDAHAFKSDAEFKRAEAEAAAIQRKIIKLKNRRRRAS